MFSSLRAGFTQQRTIALGGALGAAGLASIWLVSDAHDRTTQTISCSYICIAYLLLHAFIRCLLLVSIAARSREAIEVVLLGAKCCSRAGT